MQPKGALFTWNLGRGFLPAVVSALGKHQSSVEIKHVFLKHNQTIVSTSLLTNLGALISHSKPKAHLDPFSA